MHLYILYLLQSQINRATSISGCEIFTHSIILHRPCLANPASEPSKAVVSEASTNWRATDCRCATIVEDTACVLVSYCISNIQKTP